MLTTEPPRKPYKENKIISKKRCADEVGTLGVSLVSVLDKTPVGLRTTRSYPAEKAMAPHSSTLAWKIPQTEEPGSLQSMGLQIVRHN